MKLENGNSTIIRKHILKLFTYDKCSNVYYVIIYFEGKKNIDTTWNTYKKHVLERDFPSDKSINKELGFQDIEIEKFRSSSVLKFAKTSYGSNIEIFHIMESFSITKT